MSDAPCNARWFSSLGSCRCGKAATGRLMSDRNADLGAFCRRCAEAAIKRADKLREARR